MNELTNQMRNQTSADTHTQYSQITATKNYKDAICHCLRYIDEKDAAKFIRKFKRLPEDKVHTYNVYVELLVGAFLASNGLHVQYERRIGTKTPDWCIVDVNLHPQWIVESSTLHARADLSRDIMRQYKERGLWGGGVKSNTRRLYQAIQRKAVTYRALTNEHNLAYVVAIYCEPWEPVKQQEIDECLFSGGANLFEQYPEVSGVLFFNVGSCVNFVFTYEPNPCALRPIDCPSGTFVKHKFAKMLS